MSERAGEIRVACYTLGCKVNGYESQAMLEQFERLGARIVEPQETADVYLVNTCTVTQIAARKSRQILHRMRAQNPEALVVACGCYVDQNSKDGTDLSDIADMVISNRDKEEAARKVLHRLSCREVPEGEAFSISSGGVHTRAFLKVQDGCRQFCSYCIIPYVRGPLRSKPLADAVKEAATLADNGLKEVVLTGIHLSSYGRDLEGDEDLADLILAIAAIPGIRRIRLGSLEAGIITDRFMERIGGLKKFCPHFHLSLQSGCDATLKSMNRRYTAEEFYQAVLRIRRVFPDAAVTTDVIAGFPGETEADFEESLAFVRKVRFADLHVFPYSRREGTVAAARKDQIPKAVKTERAERLLTLKKELSEAFHSQYVGRTVEVLAEQETEGGVWEGYTANYCKVRMQGEIHRNQILSVQIQYMESMGNEIYLVGVPS